ncbi:MAG: T9SS type A sorting domain-containing protein, partial [Chitinispirillales bacterium]|nr:T9SS type A sorting domain-containing protein [Chitinispirillales bacterium]
SRSADKGKTFAESSSPGASGFQKFRLVPKKEGDIWVPLSEEGLTRSTDGGTTFNKLASVSYCEAVGFGKAAEGMDFPAVFIFGTVNGVTGVFMSVDEGENWWRANDNRHQYGGLANGEFVVGDMNVYGRVYMSTAGRGIVYGEITGYTAAVKSNLKTAAASAVKIRGSALRISAARSDVHHVHIFDLKGRQIYKRSVTGPVTLSMNRVLPKGNYVVSVKRNGTDIHRSKLRIVK